MGLEMEVNKKRVCVLLSTYNGEPYLSTQLNSLLEQEDVSLTILIRDDGSKDHTCKIIKKYADFYPNIHWIQGENIGFVQSFWFLVNQADGFDYYAFCDQDDVWEKDKLSAAISSLNENQAMLYTSNVTSVNNDLEQIQEKGFPFEGVLTYADALQRPVLPGCTFVWNDLLQQELQKYKGEQVAHDWTVYVIASAIGQVVYDQKPHILYRIHGNNTIGIDSSFEKMKKKIKRFTSNQYKNTKSKIAQTILETYELSEEKKKVTRYFANYRKHPLYFFCLMKYKEYRNINFIILLLTRKV